MKALVLSDVARVSGGTVVYGIDGYNFSNIATDALIGFLLGGIFCSTWKEARWGAAVGAVYGASKLALKVADRYFLPAEAQEECIYIK